ncbi:SIR2 family protein [Aeromonas sp. R2-3]|uniref:SIR2 family protein n=1 Tax=Aeromonas sp. R2-3 TaxID=3138461 RepID=UPI0034A42B1F
MEQIKEININDIWQNNINFLIGSGASFGLFPTLATKMKNETIETLGKYFEDTKKTNLKTLLFIHYYINCIHPVITFDIQYTKLGSECDVPDDVAKMAIIENYKKLLKNLKLVASKNKSQNKVNIFTTNYDACFADAYEELILEFSDLDFNLNDGSKGFRRKFIDACNFDTSAIKKGILGKNIFEVPQANIIHLHGSAFWTLSDGKILVNYEDKKCKFPDNFFFPITDKITELDAILNNTKSVRDDFDKIIFDAKFSAIENKFWDIYKKLPIVNPTKWKFHETVFDEHYYQMLRLMSYELEKHDSTLIVFGFSFADEHITNLVKRSLGNKTLTMYICCFDDISLEYMSKVFKGFNNVKLVKHNTYLNFDAFNNDILKVPN